MGRGRPGLIHARGGRRSPFGKPAARAIVRSALVLAAATAVVAALSVDLTHGGPVTRADPRVARWAYTDLPGRLASLCWRMTHLGDSWFLAVVVVLAAAWLYARRHRVDALLLCATAAGTALVTTVLKHAFHRSRPLFVDPAEIPHSFSFPSGHASGAFAVYLLAALLLTERVSRGRRVAAAAAALAVAVLVAATRVLILVHFLSDVLAGGAVGLGMVAAAWLVRMTIRRPG